MRSRTGVCSLFSNEVHYVCEMSAIEDRVCRKITERAARGVVKYGVTMERTELTMLDWLRHAQEEAMDTAIYLERIIRDIEKAKEQIAGIE